MFENIVHKIKNIILGWTRGILGKSPDFAKNRLEICMNCSDKIKIAKQ